MTSDPPILFYGDMMRPYYEDESVTIYHGDGREILPDLAPVDLVLTDPPYPDQHLEYGNSDISFLDALPCRQMIFWSAKVDFPLDYTAIHIWDKLVGCASMYERIFERHGQRAYRVYRAYFVNGKPAAQMCHEIWTGHQSQKPQQLISKLITDSCKSGALILDPFLGSGTTVAVAKRLHRRAIGIEISEKWCEVAANRCRQAMLPDFSPFQGALHVTV